MPRISTLGLIATPARIQVTAGKALWVPPAPPVVVAPPPDQRRGFFPEARPARITWKVSIEFVLPGQWELVWKPIRHVAPIKYIQAIGFAYPLPELVSRTSPHIQSRDEWRSRWVYRYRVSGAPVELESLWLFYWETKRYGSISEISNLRRPPTNWLTEE